MGRDLLNEVQPPATGSGELATWKPAIGEGIQGRLHGYETRTTRHGLARIAVIEDEAGGGRVGVWVTAAVLKRLFEEQKPRAGDRVAIRYYGPAEGKQYNLWGLAVERGQAVQKSEEWAADDDPFV